MPITEKHREANRRYREKQKALGKKPPPLTDERKTRMRERIRERRAEAKARGEKDPSNTWWQRNRERHRENGRKWRAANLEYAQALDRDAQDRRRSTPWGRINNNVWPIMHATVRRNSVRESKYTRALGYTWAALRAHLEAQFHPGMSWDNWGEGWEVDHIRPVSAFRYVSLEDPLFREAWRLDNLRPLWRDENQAKGNRRA